MNSGDHEQVPLSNKDHLDGKLVENEAKQLRIEDWDPPPKNCQTGSFQHLRSSTESDGYSSPSSPRKTGGEGNRRRLTFEDVLLQLEEKIKNLLKREDFRTSEARPDLKFVQRQTRYSPDVVLNKRIIDRIVQLGIGHVFLKVWKGLSQIQYLSKDERAAFKNLQTILSIVWNCCDKSAQFCDAMVRSGVVNLFIEELHAEKYVASPLSDENELYLVKAYLGILHNIVRLCSDSRKVFRSSNSVEVLQCYLNNIHDLVRTKAYLILSYIINETENDVINATDEHIAFIIGVLQEAMNSENHFSKTYAFWASEIVCGLNHLAVNDLNKVRMGRLGALPLYIKLLQSDNVDEQNLASAGLWILSFKAENKIILKQLPGCIEVLQDLTSSGVQESIRRAARGALWVIRTAPTPPPSSSLSPASSAVTVDDTDMPHIMVSYHWSNQEVMVVIKDRLRSLGYKVWMDVDNMSGSTLEAMALAVERAAVVLVCMSQGYKDSPSCRTEAEYIYRLHKDIIPLRLQRDYDPDGWLGLMVGTRLYFDFPSRDSVQVTIPRLVKELGARGRIGGRVPSTTSSSSAGSTFASVSRGGRSGHTSLARTSECQTEVSWDSSSSLLNSSTSTTSLHSYYGRMGSPVQHWSQEEVLQWLEAVHLSDISDRLCQFNGGMLLQYKKMMETAPQFFYTSLETHLHLDLEHMLLLSKAIDDLK